MDGWIILDKPENMTSRRAGAICAKIFEAKTFGHIGTLDPMASGLLPIALGNATKMIPFWPAEEKKEYLFGVRFGFQTDTLDITGHKTADGGSVPSPDAVNSILQKLIGVIDQVPPNYSAVHVNGRRAHELARAGRLFEIPPRRVTIYELELLDIVDERWTFRILCAPGTYVRSVARDIAALCGTYATVDMIRRVQTNGLTIKNSVKLDFLENLYNNGQRYQDFLAAVDFGLGDIPVQNLDDKDADLYRKGGFVTLANQGGSGLVRVYNKDIFVGIGRVESSLLRPKRTII